MAITRNRIFLVFFEPHFFGVYTRISRLVKDLGVILESRLTGRWGCLDEERTHLLWACRRVCEVRWGLRTKVVHWLYVAIIRPSISLAYLAWWPGCQMASAKKRLSRIQRSAFLGIAGAIHTTPTDAMEALTGLHPLDLLIQSEASSVAHSGVWDVGLTFTPVEFTVHLRVFRSMIPYLIWELM